MRLGFVEAGIIYGHRTAFGNNRRVMFLKSPRGTALQPEPCLCGAGPLAAFPGPAPAGAARPLLPIIARGGDQANRNPGRGAGIVQGWGQEWGKIMSAASTARSARNARLLRLSAMHARVAAAVGRFPPPHAGSARPVPVDGQRCRERAGNPPGPVDRENRCRTCTHERCKHCRRHRGNQSESQCRHSQMQDLPFRARWDAG